MRVSILIMAFLPPFKALISASSARDPASLHWASRSFLSFSRFMQHLAHSEAHQQDGLHQPLLWQPSLLRVWPHWHLIQIGSKLVELRFQLPLCSSNGLVDISKVCKCLIGIRKLLLSGTSLAISGLKQCTAFLKCVLHSCSLAISCNLSISSCRFGSRFLINLNLSIPDL